MGQARDMDQALDSARGPDRLQARNQIRSIIDGQVFAIVALSWWSWGKSVCGRTDGEVRLSVVS